MKVIFCEDAFLLLLPVLPALRTSYRQLQVILTLDCYLKKIGKIVFASLPTSAERGHVTP